MGNPIYNIPIFPFANKNMFLAFFSKYCFVKIVGVCEGQARVYINLKVTGGIVDEVLLSSCTHLVKARCDVQVYQDPKSLAKR